MFGLAFGVAFICFHGIECITPNRKIKRKHKNLSSGFIMQDMKPPRTRNIQHIEPLQVLVRGAMAVFYFGNLIALVDELGSIVWRNEQFPIFLIEYLIEHPTPQGQWN